MEEPKLQYAIFKSRYKFSSISNYMYKYSSIFLDNNWQKNKWNGWASKIWIWNPKRSINFAVPTLMGPVEALAHEDMLHLASSLQHPNSTNQPWKCLKQVKVWSILLWEIASQIITNNDSDDRVHIQENERIEAHHYLMGSLKGIHFQGRIKCKAESRSTECHQIQSAFWFWSPTSSKKEVKHQ